METDRGRAVRTMVSLVCLAAAIDLRSAAQTFRSTTDIVSVPVTVTNRSGLERVRDLTVDQFRIFEEGVEQDIVAFTRQRRSLSLCITLDSSASMEGPRQRLAAEAVRRLIAGLEPNDEVSLVVFAGHAEVPITWTQVSRFPSIDWSHWKTAPSTAILDGVRRSLETMESSHNLRSAILVISDGDETSSRVSLSKIVASRRQSETAIYAFRVGDFWQGRTSGGPPQVDEHQAPTDPGVAVPPDRTERDVLRELSQDSGGWTLPVRTARDVEQAVGSLVDELNGEYVLGYTPRRAPDGKYRKIRVVMRDGARKARYRSGYLANPPG